jgi:hypothetical protein
LKEKLRSRKIVESNASAIRIQRINEDMKRMLFAMVAGSMPVMMIAEAQDAEIQRARETLQSSAAAYRAVLALRDKLS